MSVFNHTNGPRDARVILVGEAWGEQEAYRREPFVGYSGKELDRMLFDAGLSRSNILCTNLIDAHPAGNDFTKFLQPNSDRTAELNGIRPTETLVAGRTKLHSLIDTVKPELIIGCGNWPLWALTSHAKTATVKGYKLPSGVMKWRGSQTYTEQINGTIYPYLPIIHPAAITREWSLRNITVHDLRSRASRFLTRKTTWAEPEYNFDYSANPTSIKRRLREWLRQLQSGKKLNLCCDVETYKRRILAVIGIADEHLSLAIPFFFFDEKGQLVECFTSQEEADILHLCSAILNHPNTYLLNQNCAYDYQFLRRCAHVGLSFHFDTMLGHHVMWPGTPKDLAYLASLYCDHYLYWKDESQDWDAGETNAAEMWRYNCKDTRKTFEIAFELKPLIEHFKLSEQFNFQMEQWELSQSMTDFGVNWDTAEATRMRSELVVLGREIENFLMECIPDDLKFAPSGKPWYSSNSHSQYIFYDRLGIQPVKHKKTKQNTLDKESFETLKKRAPYLAVVFDNLKKLRSIEVFKNNFLTPKTSPDGRMHSSFNIGGTETYRWSSSSNPFEEGLNLQNIPAMRE